MSEVFTVPERMQVFERVLALAEADPRVTAGAIVGSLAANEGDRWSDLDLTFAVTSEGEVMSVLDSLAEALAAAFDAVHLFDLPSDGVIYRVLLLRGGLQVDLSVAPQEKFGSRGLKFRLLFGRAAEQAAPSPPSPSTGYTVHHAVRARLRIERGRVWQAEFWISEARKLALGMACARFGLAGAYGRCFDQLPPEVLAQAERGLVRSLDAASLLDATAAVISLLVSEAAHVTTFDPVLAERLRLLARPWSD